MAGWKLFEIGSVAELRALAPAWDDLWQRSETALPTQRAEGLALWLEQFAPQACFRALAVEGDGKLQAALPLIGRRLKGVVRVASLPGNHWAGCGDLLLDPDGDSETSLDLLAAALNRLPWPLIWFDFVRIESSRWQALAAACQRGGMKVETHEQFRIGQVDVRSNWNRFLATRSRLFRRHLKRVVRRLESGGPAQFRTYRRFEPGQLEAVLRRGFEVEDNNWKGAAGTSVLKSGMFEFFHKQARQLAQAGLLRLCSLDHGGRMIAFEYGYAAKGVYVPHKVGYDEAYAACSPGQVVLMRHLEQMFDDPAQRLLDFAGPLNDSTRRWATSTYPLGRLVLSPRRWSSRLLMGAYQAGRAAKKRFRPAPDRNVVQQKPEPEAADHPAEEAIHSG